MLQQQADIEEPIRDAGVSVPVVLDAELEAFKWSDMDKNGELSMAELHEALKMAYAHQDTKRQQESSQGASLS